MYPRAVAPASRATCPGPTSSTRCGPASARSTTGRPTSSARSGGSCGATTTASPRAPPTYTVKEHWVDNRPRGTANVDQLLATDDEAERELYRFLTAVDWVATAEVQLRPVDDPLPLGLVDGRTAVLADRSDHIWLRLLDVAAALSARTYACDGSLVVEVVDPLGFAAGRFALDASPEGGTCLPTDLSPDLTVPVGVLSAAYLGGQAWARLAAAGLVDEDTPGAVARATALFSTPRAPYCSTPF